MVTTDFESRVAESLGRIEQKVDDLSGPRGRLSQLEDSQVRQWWVTVAVVPVTAALHAIARKLGVDI